MTTILTISSFILYFLACVTISDVARHKEVGAKWGFIYALIFTPFLAVLIIIASEINSEESNKKRKIKLEKKALEDYLKDESKTKIKFTFFDEYKE